MEGSWEAVTYSMTPAAGLTVNTPDVSTPCTCVDFNLWYNPNDEPGADFFCANTDFTDASPENIMKIPADDECVLLCDNFLAANIKCQNGGWLDADPQMGIACYKAPPTTAGPGPAPTTITTPANL